MDKNAKVIKGLSIATIVLSALSIIGLLIVVGLISWAGSMMNDPNVARYLLDDYTYGYGHSYDSYLEGVLFVTGGLSIAVALVFIDVIFHAFVLVTGIMGLRHCNEPEKLNVTFICAIISACLCLIGGGWITMAVLIILAVYIYKFRKGPQMPPVYGYAPGYGQPYYAQPQGQPQQPYYNQAGQPQGYAQPGSAPIPPVAADGYAQPAGYAQPSVQPGVQPSVPVAPVPPAGQPYQSAEFGQPQAPFDAGYHEEGTYQYYEQVEPKTVSVETETVVESPDLPDLEAQALTLEEDSDTSREPNALATEPIASMTGSDVEFAGDLQEASITGKPQETSVEEEPSVVTAEIGEVDGDVAAEVQTETEVEESNSAEEPDTK